ncbi:hypothetical protein ES703_74300 [subsurface metagenome]
MTYLFLILESVLGFFFGAMCGVCRISFRAVILLASLMFVVTVAIDPLLLPSFFNDMGLLLFGSGIIVVYFVLGRAIYGVVNATGKGAEKFHTFHYLVEEVKEKG